MTTSRVPGPMGMDDTQPLNPVSGLMGGGSLPGPVGNQAGVPLDAGVPDKPQAVKGAELSLVASYPRPQAWTPAKEKDLIGKETWFPHTMDFLAVAGKGSKEIASPEDFLLKITEASAPISRLNFFSHGVTGKIATSGEVDPSGTSCSLDTGWTSVIGSKRIADPYAKTWGDEGQNSGSVTITVGGKKFSLDDVRAKFTHDAELFLYICHGGVDPMLLQNVSNTFQVKVKAFSRIIVYCAPSNFPASRQHRVNVLTGTKPSDSCPNAVSDFHQLTPDRGASPRLP